VPIKYIPRQRREGAKVPEGLSVTDCLCRVHIYIRRGDQIATIKLPKRCWVSASPKSSNFGMYYEVYTR